MGGFGGFSARSGGRLCFRGFGSTIRIYRFITARLIGIRLSLERFMGTPKAIGNVLFLVVAIAIMAILDRLVFITNLTARCWLIRRLGHRGILVVQLHIVHVDFVFRCLCGWPGFCYSLSYEKERRPGFYFDRVAGGHRDHWHLGFSSLAGFGAC